MNVLNIPWILLNYNRKNDKKKLTAMAFLIRIYPIAEMKGHEEEDEILSVCFVHAARTHTLVMLE